MWPFKMQSLSDRIVQLESKIHRFENVTDIKLSAAADFYAAIGRFPTMEEIKSIRLYGVEEIVNTLCPNVKFFTTDIKLQKEAWEKAVDELNRYLSKPSSIQRDTYYQKGKELHDRILGGYKTWDLHAPGALTKGIEDLKKYKWNRDDLGCSCFWAMVRETGMEIRTRLRFFFGTGVVELKVGSEWKYLYVIVPKSTVAIRSESIKYKIYELLTGNGK